MLKNSSHRNDDFSPDSAAPKSPVFSIIMPLSSHIHAWLTHLKNDMCKYPTISSSGQHEK